MSESESESETCDDGAAFAASDCGCGCDYGDVGVRASASGTWEEPTFILPPGQVLGDPMQGGGKDTASACRQGGASYHRRVSRQLRLSVPPHSVSPPLSLLLCSERCSAASSRRVFSTAAGGHSSQA